MPQLIKGRALVADAWTLLRDAVSRADRSAEDALQGLSDFDGSYAATARDPRPRFRRRTEHRNEA